MGKFDNFGIMSNTFGPTPDAFLVSEVAKSNTPDFKVPVQPTFKIDLNDPIKSAEKMYKE